MNSTQYVASIQGSLRNLLMSALLSEWIEWRGRETLPRSRRECEAHAPVSATTLKEAAFPFAFTLTSISASIRLEPAFSSTQEDSQASSKHTYPTPASKVSNQLSRAPTYKRSEDTRHEAIHFI